MTTPDSHVPVTQPVSESGPEVLWRPAELIPDSTRGRISCRGDWSLETLDRDIESQLEQTLRDCSGVASPVRLDGGELQRLDTAGAWVLRTLIIRLEEAGNPVEIEHFQTRHRDLLIMTQRHAGAVLHANRSPDMGWLEHVGRATWEGAREIFHFLAFLGESTLVTLHCLARPSRVRWQAVFSNLQSAGLYAMPIVGLMSFLIGIVLAYQGGSQLRLYGANLFIADLVGITLLRELGPMLTAIMVAGRTGSAFTAQIATMRITDEIDALRTLGIGPMELLVVPKLLALMVAMPLLTVFADMLGLLGAMIVAALSLDVSFHDFMLRLQTPIMLKNYLIGLLKTPVFAVIVVLIGCYQGFRVSGGADSVGRQVTTSVVQAIFLVIMADAVFSILLSWLGV